MDTYGCPAGQVLNKSGEPHLQNSSLSQRYTGSETHGRACPLKASCITAKSSNRDIWRNQHETVLENHRQRMADNSGLSRERSHQFNADDAVSLLTVNDKTVRCQKVVAEDGQEVRLYCHSSGREQK